MEKSDIRFVMDILYIEDKSGQDFFSILSIEHDKNTVINYTKRL